jgi:hypothetical protein
MTDEGQRAEPEAPASVAPAAEPNDSMEIHKPKPVHNWREFAAEILVIVTGVLIALTAEQAVEAVHWHHKVEQAEAAIRIELRDDDAPQAYARAAATNCYSAQLDRIQAAVETKADRLQVAALAAAYAPPARSWDEEAWKAAVASDVGTHTPADHMILWSLPYRLVPALNDTNGHEAHARAELGPLHRTPGRLSPSEADRILAAVQSLRADNQLMTTLSLVFLVGVKRNDAWPSAPERDRVLDDLRVRNGGCVVTPSIAGVDPTSQVR